MHRRGVLPVIRADRLPSTPRARASATFAAMPPSQQPTPNRNLALELVRITEGAAIAASRWMGRGDKDGADGAAVDAMRRVLSDISMDGIVVIGEGEKDDAPMLFNGERVGNGQLPQTDVAVDPIDGTTLTSLGRANALSVIAVADRGSMFDPGPFVYMEKIATGPDAAHLIDITKSATENLEAVAEAKGESVQALTAVILDRDRHDDLIAEVREAGARIRLIPDGDVAGAILHRLAQHRRRHPLRDRRHPRGGNHRGGHQVHGRRPAGPAVAPQRARAQGPDQAGLRHGASADPG